MFCRMFVVASVLGICWGPQPVTAEVLDKTVRGRVELKSINALEFAPDGVLLIGDGRGAQVFAVKTQGAVSKREQQPVPNIEKQIASRLGVESAGIEIIDLAVNPLTRVPYIAVRKQDDRSNLIVTVNANGQIDLVDLDDVEHARVKLVAGQSRVNAITDIAWADDRVIVAGRSNEEFASKIFSVSAPLSHEDASTAFSAETYHVSHRRWETKAPMSVVIPLKENGKTYVVGAFSCTPIVKYPLDSLQPNAVVKGTSMIELGSGNRPVDMLVYERDGKQFVLANTFRFHHERKPFGPSPYWTVKFEQGLLLGQETVNEQAVRRLKSGDQPATDRMEMVEDYHGVTQMDKWDAGHALVLRNAEAGSNLEVLPLP